MRKNRILDEGVFLFSMFPLGLVSFVYDVLRDLLLKKFLMLHQTELQELHFPSLVLKLVRLCNAWGGCGQQKWLEER